MEATHENDQQKIANKTAPEKSAEKTQREKIETLKWLNSTNKEFGHYVYDNQNCIIAMHLLPEEARLMAAAPAMFRLMLSMLPGPAGVDIAALFRRYGL